MSQVFAPGGQSIGASASASVLPMNTQGRFPLGLTALISLQSKGLSGVVSNITTRNHQFFDTQQTKHNPLEEGMRELQTISAFLLWETHEQYEKAKRYDTRRWAPPGWKVSNMLMGKSRRQLLTAPKRMKWLGHSGNNTQLWMCLVVKVKSNDEKNNIAQELRM